MSSKKSKSDKKSHGNKLPSVKLGRILAILLYDSLIILALLIAAICVLFVSLSVINIPTPEPNNIYFRVYLLGIILSYYHICWAYMANGQTIGMKAWKVKLINTKAQYNKKNHISNLYVSQSILRLLGGLISLLCFGLGYLVMYFNKQHKTLSDLISDTQYQKIG